MTEFDQFLPQASNFDAGLLFETTSGAGFEYISYKNPSHGCWVRGHRGV